MRALRVAILSSAALTACGQSSSSPKDGEGTDAGNDGGSADNAPADGSAADAAAERSGATVMGTLTLPGTASGKTFAVRVMTGPGSAPVAEATGLTSGAATLPYSIADVPAGTYFLLGFVDVDGSGGTSSTPGDYAGWYGHTGDGNPPAAPNAAVPASGSVTFDWALVLR